MFNQESADTLKRYLDDYFGHMKRGNESHICVSKPTIEHHSILLEKIDSRLEDHRDFFDDVKQGQLTFEQRIGERISSIAFTTELDKEKTRLLNEEILKKLNTIHSDLKTKEDIIAQCGTRITTLEINVTNLTTNVENNIKKLQTSLQQINSINNEETIGMIQWIKNALKLSKGMTTVVSAVVIFVITTCTLVVNIDQIYKLVKGDKKSETSPAKVEEKKIETKKEEKKQ